MTPITDPENVVRAVSAGVSRLVAGRLSDAEREAQVDALAELYAETTDVRHPFAPAGDEPMRTRAELRVHFARSGARHPGAEHFEPIDETVHRTEDPELVVYEFAYAGRIDGRDFRVPLIFVVRVRDGLIVESRDYAHHLAMARAFGRLDDVLAELRGP